MPGPSLTPGISSSFIRTVESSPGTKTPSVTGTKRAPVGVIEGLKGDVEVNLPGTSGSIGPLVLAARVLTNPQIRACLLVRLAARPLRGTAWIWRNLLITLHSMDVREGALIEPGLRLPHPYGIAIAAAASIERGVSLGHNVTLLARTVEGEPSDEPIVIGPEVKVFTNSTFTAGVTVGAGAVIGSHALVTTDVAAGEVVRAHSRH